MAFKFFKKFFPIKAESLNEFVEIIRNKKCIFVIGKVGMCPPKDIGRMGPQGFWEFSFFLESNTATGRKVVYQEVNKTIYANSGEYEKLEKAALTVWVTAHAKLKEIKEILPNIIIALANEAGEFTEKMYQQMYERAKIL